MAVTDAKFSSSPAAFSVSSSASVTCSAALSSLTSSAQSSITGNEQREVQPSVKGLLKNGRWPQPPAKKEILTDATADREVRRIRAEALPTIKGDLRELYRTLELPGANPLKATHAALDTAVLAAYGFYPANDLLAQLLSLNQSVAANFERGTAVTAPGLAASNHQTSLAISVQPVL